MKNQISIDIFVRIAFIFNILTITIITITIILLDPHNLLIILSIIFYQFLSNNSIMISIEIIKHNLFENIIF